MLRKNTKRSFLATIESDDRIVYPLYMKKIEFKKVEIEFCLDQKRSFSIRSHYIFMDVESATFQSNPLNTW
jgi:hypothetical protein